MKCQILLFSKNNNKITSLSSAESIQRVVKVKVEVGLPDLDIFSMFFFLFRFFFFFFCFFDQDFTLQYNIYLTK